MGYINGFVLTFNGLFERKGTFAVFECGILINGLKIQENFEITWILYAFAQLLLGVLFKERQ